jgi:stage III sporulation protein AF
MLEIFKNWISAMLCIGIFITFIRLIIPKTNLKKYIYSLIGIITIITVVSPIIDFMKNQSLEESVTQVLQNISNPSSGDVLDSEKYRQAQEENVKKEFIEEVKKDINLKLTQKGIKVENIEVFLNSTYDIEKVLVKIKKLDNKTSTLESVNKVVEYINKEYDISFSKIEVVEEGG